MDEHRQVDVVEVAESKQFRLTTEKFKLLSAGLVYPPFDVAVLFRRHGEEDELPAQCLKCLRIAQAHCGSENGGNLSVMATGMGSACFRVCIRVTVNH